MERHHESFERLKRLSESELTKMLALLIPIEDGMDEEFWKARKSLSNSELQLLGFEIYGKDARHYFFRGVLHNYGIEQRPDKVAPSAFRRNIPVAAGEASMSDDTMTR